MRIGLFGIYGTYNFGCEAIVRGAYKLIKKLYPESEVIYFSYSYEYDSKILSDLPIKIYDVHLSRNFFKRVVNKFFHFINYNDRIQMINFKGIMDQVDMIFSIGGDIYTIPAILRENKKYRYYNNLIDFCNQAIENNKSVILYGASVGPFGEYEKAVQYYKKNLEKYKKIVCREYATIEYLNTLGLNNTMFLPDPAFQLRTTKQGDIAEPRFIGINLSPLSLNEIYGNYNESILPMARLLDKVYEYFHIDLLFIPHVFSKNDGDNDLKFLQKVMEKMKDSNQKHVQIAESNGGFLGVKKQLKKCHFVVAARMHCAINAINEDIPAILLSYSQKSIGMCQYIYESEKWLVDIKEIEKNLLNKMSLMMEEKDCIKVYLQKRNLEIQKYFEESFVDILK